MEIKKDQAPDTNHKPKFSRPKDDIEEKTVMTKFINKTTKGGRRSRFSALVVCGDKKGRVGFGLGKSKEITVAVKKAGQAARNSMVKVLINKKGGIYHEVSTKFGATKVLLKTAPVGAGIIAGGVIRTILELAGYKDVCAKNVGRASSPTNMATATINGLLSQKTPRVIAGERGLTTEQLFKGGFNK
jgi:small subunit ribosomal protein S5